MIRRASIILIIFACGIFAPGMGSKQSVGSETSGDVVTVFLTGGERGVIQPCGCAEEQLGGLDRRGSILESAPAQSRLIVETGAMVEVLDEQEIYKLETMVQSMDVLGYDLVNFTQRDIEVAREAGLLEVVGEFFEVISASGDGEIAASYSKVFNVEGADVRVNVAAFDVESGMLDEISGLFGGEDEAKVNILLLSDCEPSVLEQIKGAGGIDCIVCSNVSDDAMVISAEAGEPLVVSVGRYGKYVGRLEIAFERNGELNLEYKGEAVRESLPQDEELAGLYKSYQMILKDAKLIEKQPRMPLDEGEGFVGSKMCGECHEYEYEKWSDQKHSHAFETLVEVGSEFDPECVGCHVVGLEYEGGFVSVDQTEHLTDVGCESCHGAGQGHSENLGEGGMAKVERECIECHTPERSPGYWGNEKKYFKKNIHWREPNIVDNVKTVGDDE